MEDIEDEKKEINEMIKDMEMFKTIAETLNEKTSSGEKMVLKPTLKKLFLQHGMDEEMSNTLTKIIFLYFCSGACVSDLPMDTKDTKKAKELIDNFLTESFKHGLPVMLVMKILFSVIENSSNSFFDVEPFKLNGKDEMEVQ